MRYNVKSNHRAKYDNNVVTLLFLLISIAIVIISTVNYEQEKRIDELENHIHELNEIVAVQEKQIEFAYTEIDYQRKLISDYNKENKKYE